MCDPLCKLEIYWTEGSGLIFCFLTDKYIQRTSPYKPNLMQCFQTDQDEKSRIASAVLQPVIVACGHTLYVKFFDAISEMS